MLYPVFTSNFFSSSGLSNLGHSANPAIVDIDGDGDLDAFVGNREGNTLFLRNTGTVSTPVFAAPDTNPFGLVNVGEDANPTFIDIDGDGDGDVDAFVGNRVGDTLFFRNTGTTTSPVFAIPESNPFGLSNGGSFVSPTFVDIDGDGDADAFVGNLDGNTLLFRNTGTVSNPVFAISETNPFGLINVGFLSSPTFSDIDGDGDLDAFIGESSGNTSFFRNTGTAFNPIFAPRP